MAQLLGNYVVPFFIVFLAVAVVMVIRFIGSRYKKVSPNKVGVFYGRKYKTADGKAVGFKVLSGGGRILMPLVENYAEMSTAAFQVNINEEGIPNKDNVKFSLKGVATCKLSTVPEDLNRATEAFLGKTDKEIEGFVLNILKGHLRSIVGKLDIDTLLRKRDEFNKQVMDESSVELKNLGIEVVNLVIQDINDGEGYIDALGKRAVAETKAEAEIKVSNANRDASLIKAENEAKVAEAEKERDVKKSMFKTEADTKKAEADKALSIALAAQDQKLKIAEAQRDAAEKTAQIEVQEKESLRKEAELKATVLREADAAKQKTIIEAEASKQQQVLAAQAQAEANNIKAESQKKYDTLVGEGEANKVRATLVAQAEGEAAKKKEQLLAEALGTERLAEALGKMSSDARMIIILDKLPGLFASGGDAAAKVATAVFSSVAAPLGSIDKLSIVDVGGNGQGVNKIASLVPNIVFQFLAQAKAQGMDLGGLLGKVGVKTEGLEELLAGLGDALSGPPQK